MYAIILCAVASLVISLLGFFLGGWGWLGGTLIAVSIFIVSWIFLTRKLGALLQPKMELVRKQAETGQIEGARQALTELLPMGKWVPMLKGQIESQLGMLALHGGEEAKAIEHLSRSSRRVAEGQLMLAALYYRKKEPQLALKVMSSASPFHRKNSFFQNVYAYFLQKEDRLDEAIQQMNALVKKAPDDPIAKDSLLRLQNRQRLDMKVFGNEWFALGLERPPTSMGELRSVRKGFRQPPKASKQQARGGRSSSKKKKRSR